MCIASGGEFNQLLSIEDLAFCCKSCGDGCNGGYPIQAWIYFATDGLVTGGNYNTTDVSYWFRNVFCCFFQTFSSFKNKTLQKCNIKNI